MPSREQIMSAALIVSGLVLATLVAGIHLGIVAAVELLGVR